MVVFSDGFDDGTIDAWTSSAGSPTVSTDYAKEGSYSIQINAATEYVYKTVAAANTYYARFYVLFTSLPNGNNENDVIARLTTAGTYVCGMQLNYTSVNGLKWRAFTREGGADVNTLSSLDSPTTGVWYCWEMMADLSSADGTADGNYRFWFNGVEDTSIQRLNKDTDYTTMSRIYIGAYTGNSNPDTYYIDSIVVDTSYIGPIPSIARPSKMNLQHRSPRSAYLMKKLHLEAVV